MIYLFAFLLAIILRVPVKSPVSVCRVKAILKQGVQNVQLPGLWPLPSDKDAEG